MKIVIALLILSGVVFFHELGHFLAAKKSGIRVNEFAIGMGPKLLSVKRGDTVYAWRLLPIGGMCVMQGEDEEDHSEGSFQSAKTAHKLLVVAAGPLFNFLLAFIVAFIVIFSAGADRCYINSVNPGSNAEAAGLTAGDLIVSFEGQGVSNSRELYMYLMMDGLPEDEIDIGYLRESKRYNASYAPDEITRYLFGFYYDSETDEPLIITGLTEGLPMDKAGVEPGDIITGINGTSIESYNDFNEYISENPLDGSEVSIEYEHEGVVNTVIVAPVEETEISGGFSFNMQREKVNLAETLKYSAGELKYWVNATFKSLAGLITGRFSIRDLSGPVGIVKTIGDVYEQASDDGGYAPLISMLNMIILLSVNLGILNLLPLPALDGGRILFMLIGIIRRKPVSQKVEGMVHYIGILALFGFAILIAISDVMKLF